MEDGRKHAAHFPRDADRSVLMAFGPEEIEEECCAEDEGYEYASEDVVGGGANVIVVVDVNTIRRNPVYFSLACSVG